MNKFSSKIAMQNGVSVILQKDMQISEQKSMVAGPKELNAPDLKKQNAYFDNFIINTSSLKAFSRYKKFFALGPYIKDTQYLYEYQVYREFFKPYGFRLMRINT